MRGVVEAITSRPTLLPLFVIALSQFDPVVPCEKNHRQQGGADVGVVGGDQLLSVPCLADFTNHDDEQ